MEQSITQWRTERWVTVLCVRSGIMWENQPCFWIRISDVISSTLSFLFGIMRIFNPRAGVLVGQEHVMLLVSLCCLKHPGLPLPPTSTPPVCNWNQVIPEHAKDRILVWAWERKGIKLCDFFRGTKFKGKKRVSSVLVWITMSQPVSLQLTRWLFWVATISA